MTVRTFLSSCWLLAFVLALPSAAQTTLRYAESTSIPGMDPYSGKRSTAAQQRVFSLIHEGLAIYDHDFKQPFLRLIQDWEPKSGPTSSITLGLVEAAWSDGTPFTSADVAFTLEYAKNARGASYARQVSSRYVESVSTPAPRTVVLHLRERREAEAVLALLEFPMLPAHRFNASGMQTESAGGKSLDEEPVGLGPYQLDEINLYDNYIRFAANQGYWKGAPNIDRVELLRISDESTMVNYASSGNLDLVVRIPHSQIPIFEDNGNFVTKVYEAYSFHAFAYNFRNPLLADLPIRRAMALGTNRQEILDNFYAGLGQVLDGPVVTGHPDYAAGLPRLSYNHLMARRELAAAGYSDRNGDKIRESPSGERLSFRLVTVIEDAGTETTMQAVATAFKGYMERIGIEILIEPRIRSDYQATLHETRDFDIIWVEWSFDPSYEMTYLFHSDASRGDSNVGGYGDRIVDEQLDRIASAPTPEEARQASQALQYELAIDQPYLFLYQVEQMAAVKNTLVATALHPFYFFSYISDWSFLR
ncbi:MAG: ABC transporter substrate-binding protein [Rhodothermales bacterium]|nr:ABC transporter substrate-binding protein [Rhodothermales bacterium]MBO6780996.1 ABC transporter substrate-binding protein [Rhodothermales bacterium]